LPLVPQRHALPLISATENVAGCAITEVVSQDVSVYIHSEEDWDFEQCVDLFQI